MSKKSIPIQFYIDEELDKQFRKVCETLSINRSEFFRKKMKELIESNKDKFKERGDIIE